MLTDDWRSSCPQYLHRPFQFLWFESDELSVVIIFATVALILDSKLWWGIAVAVPMLYMRLKKSYPRGFLKHSLYALGVVQFRSYPDAAVTEYLE